MRGRGGGGALCDSGKADKGASSVLLGTATRDGIAIEFRDRILELMGVDN